MSNLRRTRPAWPSSPARSSFQLNYTFIYPGAAEIKGFQKNIGWARWPRVDADEPSHVTLGGFNLGVSQYSENPDLAFEAAECIARPESQLTITEHGRARAHHRGALRRPEGQEGAPVRRR